MSARKTKDGFPAGAYVVIPAENKGEYVALVNPDEMQWEGWYRDGNGIWDSQTFTTPGYPTWKEAIAEVKQRRQHND